MNVCCCRKKCFAQKLKQEYKSFSSLDLFGSCVVFKLFSESGQNPKMRNFSFCLLLAVVDFFFVSRAAYLMLPKVSGAQMKDKSPIPVASLDSMACMISLHSIIFFRIHIAKSFLFSILHWHGQCTVHEKGENSTLALLFFCVILNREARSNGTLPVRLAFCVNYLSHFFLGAEESVETVCCFQQASQTVCRECHP